MCVSVWVDKLTCRPSGRSLSPLSALRWSAARRSWRGQRSRTAGGTERVEDLSYCRSAAYDLQQEVCQDCIQDSRIIPSCVCGSSRTCSDDLGDDVQISLHVFVAQVLKRPRGRETSSKSTQQSSRFMFRLGRRFLWISGLSGLRSDVQECHNISCLFKVCCFLL